jgi:alcohol dehydrogenase class IV
VPAIFEFATAHRIIFGAGTASHVGSIAAAAGTRALVVTGRSSDRLEPVARSLADHKVGFITFSIEGEPTVAMVREGTAFARRESCDLVIGVGGGSAIDAGKAIAAMLANPGDILDYLEVIGGGNPLKNPSLPFLAVPTTAGTGSEATKNAVLLSEEHRVKASMRSVFMLPAAALVDPLLTVTLPPADTAATGLDALTQLIEPFVSGKANPMTDMLCKEGMGRVARSLARAFAEGTDPDAREDMAWASLLGGMALANAGLGAAHGFAAPIGGMFRAPHGAVCARLLPLVMELNIGRSAGSIVDRYAEVARILTGSRDATPQDGVAWVASLSAKLGIPGLSAYGLAERDISAVVEKAAESSSMKGNPVRLTVEELKEILVRAL